MTTPISLRLSEDEVAKLDELRPPKCSRSVYLRQLLRLSAPSDEAPSHDESLRLLAESARAGHVQAQIALERALRAAGKKEDEVGDAISRILSEG